MVAGGFLPSLEFAALLLPVTVLGGLLFGRAYSLAVDGSPGIVAWVSAVLELVGFALGVFWLWKEFG
jgi:hypothetical protein